MSLAKAGTHLSFEGIGFSPSVMLPSLSRNYGSRYHIPSVRKLVGTTVIIYCRATGNLSLDTLLFNDDGTINTEKSVDADNGYVDEYKYPYIPTGAVSSAKTKVAAPLTVASAKAKIERLRKALGAGMFKSHGQSRRAKLHNR